MCGRFSIHTPPRSLAIKLGISPDELQQRFDDWQPSWNIGPMQKILGVSEENGHRHLETYRWGLVPGWAKAPKAVKSTFNARGETVATKPMFRSAFKRWRILVPADLFYEWETLAPKNKQPYAFKRADGEPVVFAGLREYWKGEDGTELRTATIITTEAGPDMPIHNRQPVVLEEENWDHWLDPEVTDREELEPLLAPTVEGTLVHFPVNKSVGNISLENSSRP
jgi:putative SOS response-associated peptidase YedK